MFIEVQSFSGHSNSIKCTVLKFLLIRFHYPNDLFMQKGFRNLNGEYELKRGLYGCRKCPFEVGDKP